MEHLFDYLSFLAKSATLVALIGMMLMVLIRSARAVSEGDDRLEIEDLDERFRNMQQAIRQATTPEKDYKRAEKAERKAEKKRAKEAEPKPKLFVMDFHGDIRASEVSGLRESVSAVLLAAEEGDRVLVRLENPGGAVSEHGLAASQLARFRDRGIELTVAVDKVAASGGYLMACVADRIIAAPFAVIGSIGVLAELPNFHRLLERNGVDFELHTAGDYKRTLTIFGENTDEGRAKLQEQLEEVHLLFKDYVTQFRPQLDLAKVATGEHWHGERAQELGLVDELRTSDDWLLAAREEFAIFRISFHAHKKPIERLMASLSKLASRLLTRLGWA